MRYGWIPRTAGVATAAYGLAVAARPSILLGPCGWSDESPQVRAVTRMVGLRDVASGLAMVAAPGPRAMRLAVAVRVGADLADTAVLGVALRGRPQHTKALAVTTGWALLCAATALVTLRQ
ncbi:hypothetical protein [Nocardia bovistercoris]|uniref:DUF4267 domain-containing protein n=1 Tax=Nocardia bovistercoris TaxID=2785916 RepID=A0A931I7F3_9NOCA|nr:hypothetical protein [Nocardia bovistercoris]MBH0775646.1 hypothetical protein [Nocardia bovistercoris]